MVKKIKKNVKLVVCCALIMSLVAPSYAALSASDGSAFVTKSEFDSALADFNARLTTFEAGINSKIDSQVTSYLDRNGIWNGKDQTISYTNAGGLTYGVGGWSDWDDTGLAPSTGWYYVFKWSSDTVLKALADGWTEADSRGLAVRVQTGMPICRLVNNNDTVQNFTTPLSKSGLVYFEGLVTKYNQGTGSSYKWVIYGKPNYSQEIEAVFVANMEIGKRPNSSGAFTCCNVPPQQYHMTWTALSVCPNLGYELQSNYAGSFFVSKGDVLAARYVSIWSDTKLGYQYSGNNKMFGLYFKPTVVKVY